MGKKALAVISSTALAVLLALQLVPVDRANPPVTSEISAPPDVRAILERSCYDCHSNRTRWPGYSRVAPVSWYVARHVQNGRADLNLTQWPPFDLETQQYQLGEMKEQIKAGEMPLASYLWLHPEARLSAEQRRRLVTWIDEEKSLLSGGF